MALKCSPEFCLKLTYRRGWTGGGGTGIEGAESGVEVAESGVAGAGSGSRGGGKRGNCGGGLEKLEGEIAFLPENS